MTMPVVEAKDIRRYFSVGGNWTRKATLKAVDGVSFSLKAGETLAVVGESGSGKSTLGRIVAALDAPTSGDILLDGNNIAHMSASERAARRPGVQMVFQNPYGSLNPRKTVGAILEEPLVINRRGSKRERQDAVREMMGKVGLRQDHYGRYPNMFSGGQRQRIAIARALMLRPKVIVADEPVSALDVSIQAQVLNLMMDLQDEFGMAYMFISHDLSVVRHIADRVIVMYLGNIVEEGPVDTIFQSPRHPYTKLLLAAKPSIHASAKQDDELAARGELPSPVNPPVGCVFNTRCASVSDVCRTTRPSLSDDGNRRFACHLETEA